MKKALYSALILTTFTLNLSGLFVTTTFAAPMVTVTTASGGSAISADTNTANGTATWTTLTGPAFSEGATGDIGVGTIILDAPAGFVFDEAGTAPTVLLTGGGTANRNINDLADGSTIPVTQSATQLTVTITAATSNGVKNTLTWQNIRVRPTDGNPLATGNITSSGTSAVSGVTSGSTNLGTLTEVAGSLNSITVTPSSAQNISIGSTISFSASAQDANSNPLSGLTYTWAVVSAGGQGNVTSGGILTSTASGDLTVTATNGAVTGSSGTVTVNTNNIPTVGNQSLSTDENNSLAITLTGSDVNNDILTYSIVSNPSHGSFSNFNSASGTVTYTPTTNYNGADSFTFKANDGIADSAVGTVSLTINAVNSAPVLSAIGNQTVDENVNLTLNISATDPENNSITYSATNTPSGATFNTNTRTFRWKPGYDQAGTYPNVRFIANDGTSSSYEDITITVNNVNRAPVLALVGDKTGAENSELTFTLSATDPDNNTLTYSGIGLPSGASVSSTTGIFSWTPDYSQSGSATTTLKVCDTDPASLCDEETITIVVSNTNRAPIIDSIGAKSIAEDSTLTFTVSASDADGDTVSLFASNLPDGSSFATSTGIFSWKPTFNQSGSYTTVHFEAADYQATTTEDITITVTNISQDSGGIFGGGSGGFAKYLFGPAPEPVAPAPVIPVQTPVEPAAPTPVNQEQTPSNPSNNSGAANAGGQNNGIAAAEQITENPIIEAPTQTGDVNIETPAERTSLLANLADIMTIGNAAAMTKTAMKAVSDSWNSLVNFFASLF